MKELAEFLRTERLNRNLTLEAVSERSGISVSMLSSFESCDFERFGASILIRNIIRAYCRALQIEADPLIQKFSYEIEAYNIQDAGIRRYGKQMKILRGKRRMIGLPVFALLLLSAALFYGGTWVSERRSKQTALPDADRIFTQEEFPAELQERLAPAVPNTGAEKPGADLWKANEAIRNAEISLKQRETTSEEIPKAHDTQQPANQASKENVQPDNGASGQLAFSNSTEAIAADKPTSAVDENRRGNKFAVEADDKVWIQVRIDDKEIRSAMLYPGDRREWAADKSLQVVIGNAGGVHMKWNDQPLKAPRDPGRVLRFRLPEYAKAG
jgi:cytoskeletal protein RodZ